MMKYIFLDFDGVINNWYHYDGVDIKNVLILKKIIELSNAKVIVTSSNKYNFQENRVSYYQSSFYKEYIKELNKYGVEIYDLTPLVNNQKTQEIKKYIKDNKVKQYVILDDDLVDKELQDHQVFLDLYQGLKEEHIVPALNILNDQLGFYPPDFNKDETPKELNTRINSHYNKIKKKQ